MASTNIWKILIRDAKERRDGRITTWPNLWRLVGSRDGKEDGYPKFPQLDELERPVELVGGKAVTCPHPKWESICPKLQGRYWVAYYRCRKCEFYRTAKQSKRRYACCTYKATGESVVKQVSDTLAEAVNTADKIMGNKL